MIYIVFSKREELMMHRVGVKEIQQYAHLKDFLPLLEQRGTVVVVRDAQREIKPIHRFLDYLGQDYLYIYFSPPDSPYSKMECPKMFIAPIDQDEAHPISASGIQASLAGVTISQASLELLQQEAVEELLLQCIPPPVWDEFQQLHDKELTHKPSSYSIETNGNILDTSIPSLRPESIGFTIPLASRIRSIISAFLYFKMDLYGLRQYIGRRRRDRFFATKIELTGIVYTAIVNPKRQHKNWKSLVREFCLAFEKVHDATLIIKMVGTIEHKTQKAAIRLLRNLSVRCRVIVIFCHLTENRYKALIQASTFVINASDSKGIGSSLLEFMSAGKPAISYTQSDELPLNRGNSFLTDSSSSTLKQLLTESYDLAKSSPDQYHLMSENATNTLKRYCSMDSITPQFNALMDAVEAKLL
ncbi:MAG: hypothetical protein KTR30_37165 [Saprospiraceae bacterium]|nr:hypothetical protein [Saprospiraceae bacterium]